MTSSIPATLAVLIAIATAGCLEDGTAKAPPPATLAAELTAAPTAFKPQQHELMVPYWLASTVAPVFVPPPGHEDTWNVEVPPSADNVTMNATWSASTPLATVQHCMIHAAEGNGFGPMIGDKKGPSPLSLLRIAFSNATNSLIIMCMPMDEPFAFEVMQIVHLRVEFFRGAAS